MKQEEVSYQFNLLNLNLISMHRKKEDRTMFYEQYVYDSGIEYASHIVYQTGKSSSVYTIENLTKKQQINPMKLSIPQGYGGIVDNKNKALSSEMIAKNLYLINHVANDRYVMFKVHHKGIMVFGAPASDKVSEQVMAHIKKKFPAKSITSVYITHAHSDHMSGLAAYAKKGITILSDEYTSKAIKSFSRFEKTKHLFKFTLFTDQEVINGVRFYLPPNSHARGQSFAYFIEEKIIYEGDLLEIPFDNTIASYMSQVEKEFVEYLEREKIEIKRIVGHHRNGNISPEVMQAYYQKNYGQQPMNELANMRSAAY